MANMTYRERLLATKEDLQTAQVDNKVAEAKAKLRAEISNAQAIAVGLTNQRDDLLNQSSLNTSAIRRANKDAADAQREVEDLEAIFAELFPDEEG